MKKIISLCFFFLSLCSFSYSQNQQTNEPTNEQTNQPIEKLLALFPPSVLRADFLLKKYLRSNTFATYKKINGDSAAIEEIFFRAKTLSNNNTGVALLISLFGVTDYFAFHIKIPVPYLSLQFPLPLTAETREEFTQRFKNLPENFPRLFSPTSSLQHKDKLQHFFATAFLSYVFASKETAQDFGLFAEHGESAFIPEGAYDEEDLEMNRRGAMFGLALLKNENSVPSVYFFSQK